MGYELRRWLAARLPQQLSSGERIVALEVADLAHEKTRIASQENAVHIVGVRSGFTTKTVGKNLAKLAGNGIELRRPITTGKSGRPVYAVRGRELEFYVPASAECPALLTDDQVRALIGDMAESGAFNVDLYPEKLDRLANHLIKAHERSPARGSNEGGRSPAGDRKLPRPEPNAPPLGSDSSPGRGSPTSQYLQEPPLLSAEQITQVHTDVADAEEMKTFIAHLKTTYNPKSRKWWETTAPDLQGHLDDWRKTQQEQQSRSSMPPACGPCLENNPAAAHNARWRTRDGAPCPTCHPNTAADAA